MAGKLLIAIDPVTTRDMTQYRHYGSSTHKQIYLYGTIDLRPSIVNRRIGMTWGIGGRLTTSRLKAFSETVTARMRERIDNEITRSGLGCRLRQTW